LIIRVTSSGDQPFIRAIFASRSAWYRLSASSLSAMQAL
jgi:hypothetical protein